LNNSFLDQVDARKARWRDPESEKKGIRPAYRWTGPGKDGLEVVYGTTGTRPSTTVVREVWKQRHGYRAAPLLIVVAYPEERPNRAVVCGPTGDDPRVVDLDYGQAERLAAAALDEPDRHLAIRFLADALEGEPDEHPGLRNKGLLATHELLYGVPQRPDWDAATARSAPLLKKRGQDLVRGLGYEIEKKVQHSALRSSEEKAQAVAVFLQESEQADQPSSRFENQTPVTYALAHADRHNIPWVIAERSGGVRLYSTSTSGASGQRGRAETFVELNLPLLPSDQAGYLGLLFSSDALAEGGTMSQILQASSIYTSNLSERLRERVYKQVVPRLAVAAADQMGGTGGEDLERHYRTALTILFRLMFVAYAEDSRLLPLNVNAEYTRHALKTIARDLSNAINEGRDLGFDNPLTEEVESGADNQTDLWDSCKALFHAVNEGHVRWGIPPYDGGLFSTDPDVNLVGGIIEELSLTNAEFGPALTALIVDKSSDDVIGPIDFRSLSVREFGTIYEGLLESELSVAEGPLTVDSGGVYLPARDADSIVVEAREVYLHNRSGVRKSTGSYFTKPFAVDHLISHSVDPTLDEHLKRVEALLDKGRETDAAEMLFDFRVADIAMGSGHFLTAVVDRLEARYTTFLADHPVPHVTRELDGLRKAANEALGQLADTVEMENSSLLRRLIARRCVYGVDLNPLSVELARVAMWIHTFVPGLPLSFLEHNLTVGDSLTGIGTIEEVTAELANSNDGQTSLFDEPLREALREAEEPLRRLAKIADATLADIAKARQAAAEVERVVAPVTWLFDLVVAARIGEAVLPTILSADELFSLKTGHASEVIEEMRALHFPVMFPEVFLRDRPGFDVIVGNPPWEEVVVEELAFWALRFPGLNSLSAGEQRSEIARLQQRRLDLVEQFKQERDTTERLRAILHAGPYSGMGTGDPDLYKAFCWRFAHLVRRGGAIGVVVPRSVFTTKGSGDWRAEVLSESETFVTTLRNTREWVFDSVNPGYTVCLVALRKFAFADTPRLQLYGRYGNLSSMQAGLAEGGAVLTIDSLVQRDESLALPDLGSDEESKLFAKLLAAHAFGASERSDFRSRALTDFHATNDRKRGFLDPGADYSVYNHLNVGHFRFESEEGAFTYCNFDRAIEELRRRQLVGARNMRSAFSEMYAAKGQAWLDDQGTLPARSPRIAFRDVVHASNKRKVWAALLPANTIVTNKAPYLVFPHGDLRAQAFVLGMLNSSVCDWYGHLFIGLNLNYFILNGLPIPTYNPEDERCVRITRIAATLAVRDEGDYGDWCDLALKQDNACDELLAELDSIASLLYGLDDADLPLIWNDNQTLRPPLDNIKKYRASWSHT